MLVWTVRCAAAGLAVSGLAMLMGCGVSSTFITPSSVVLAPSQTFQFTVARTGLAQPVLLVNGVAGGSPSSGTITPDGFYTAPSTASGGQITIGIRGQSSSAAVALFNPAGFTPGSVAATQNPLVASYSIVVPAGTSVQVQFGLDTSYGFSTSMIQTSTGGTVTLLVAGMRAGTTYHMQAIVDLIGGAQLLDTDHSFTTGSIPAERLPNITVQQFGTGTPSDGIELLSLDPNTGDDNLLSAVATDLQGNVIWYYDLGTSDWAFPVKPLPNGHMLVNASPTGATGVNEIREIDLAGNIINRISLNAVNQALRGTAASFQISSFHHDVAVLPNGHYILLGNYQQTINNVPGIPTGTAMLGDALIDWDPQQAAVWVWSAFDHLDLTHAPYGLADWTHSNAIIYSPDDGNLILSMRNQNWIIKINYQNGAGDGSVLWRLGFGGDFTLPSGQAPAEWNYGQHYPTIVSPNSAGVFSLMFFNDGNGRLVDSNGDVCGGPGVGACYSSVPIFQLDESAMTATVLWEDNLFPYFSFCCGDALLLPNGDMEVDIAYDLSTTPGISDIEEVTQTLTPELVWEMQVHGQLAYRGLRVPSLYPGQVWPAATQSKPSRALPSDSRAGSGEGASERRVQLLPTGRSEGRAEIVP
jgi:arylsulfate sulfotransferase